MSQATQAAARAAGSSFYNGMRILPRAQREAMFEIYAFCRAVDDIADDPGPREPRLSALQQWCADVDALYAWVSSASRPGRVTVPTLVVQSLDDPIVGLSEATRATLLRHPSIALIETPFGGHCGFTDWPWRRWPDGRWAAAKIAEVAARWIEEDPRVRG